MKNVYLAQRVLKARYNLSHNVSFDGSLKLNIQEDLKSAFKETTKIIYSYS